MIRRLVDLSIAHRYLVLLFVGLAAAFGIYQLSHLPIDAVPDITNKQVVINSFDPALGYRHGKARDLPGRDRARRHSWT